MDLKEICINTRNWVDSAHDRDSLSPCKCGIEPPGSIRLEVNLYNRLKIVFCGVFLFRLRWENNIKMDLKEICIITRNWVNSAQDRVYLSPCKCGIEPPDSISLGVSLYNRLKIIFSGVFLFGVDGRTILEWILKKIGVFVELG